MAREEMTLSQALRSCGCAIEPGRRREAALALLFEELGRLGRREARRFGRLSQMDVDDVIQQLAMQLWCKGNGFSEESDGAARSYLRKCLQRRFMNLSKRLDSKERRQEELGVGGQLVGKDGEEGAGREALVAGVEVSRFDEAQLGERLEFFFGPMVRVIAEVGFTRSDGRARFLEGVEALQARSTGAATMAELLADEQARVGDGHDIKMVQNNLNKRLQRARDEINATLVAVERLCLALVSRVELPDVSERYARVASALHDVQDWLCEELELLKELALRLRERRAAADGGP